MKKALINANIVMPDHIIRNGVVVIEDGKIADFGRKIPTEGMEVIDLEGRYVGPGLIDIHTHAGGGKFFIEDPAYAAEFVLKHGVT